MQSRDPGAGCLWIAIPERIDVGILHPARGEVEFGINGLHRARGLTRPTIDAFIWIDVELPILPSLKMNTRHGQTRTQAWSRTSMQGAAITKGIPLPFLLWFKKAHKITPGVCAYRTSQVRRAWEELRCGGDEQKASDSGQGTEKKPQPQEVGVKHHDNATGTLPLERLPSRKPSRFPGSRHVPTLCAFPRQDASVVSADFVPLTVAGQRWLPTIFPAHSVGL